MLLDPGAHNHAAITFSQKIQMKIMANLLQWEVTFSENQCLLMFVQVEKPTYIVSLMHLLYN